MHTFWRDVIHGARLLRRRPGFTAVAVMTLGLGIGATTAVFSLANWVLLRPLPGVAATDRLVTIEFMSEEHGPGRTTGISPQNLADLGAAATMLTGVAAWQVQSVQVMSAGGRPMELTGEAVGGDYFGVLGVRPRLGRMLRPDESEPGRPIYAVVISSELWRTLYGGDPDVIGKTMLANRYPLTIVGVAPERFRGAERRGRTDVWYPSSIYGELRHYPDLEGISSRRAGIFLSGTVGRLAPGATAKAAEAQLRRIMERLVAAYPEDNAIYAERGPAVMEGIGLKRMSRDYLRDAVRLLLAVVAIVLVIACANVANMLLFRGVERRGEAAVRRALGATTGRLIRQQLAESLMLGLAGGVAGTAVALTFRGLFRGMQLWWFDLSEVPFDGRVFVFALTVAVGTGVTFGLVPTALSRRLDLTSALRESGGRDTSRKAYVRSAITIAQLALSLTLLVSAVLLTRTLINLYAVDLGFDADQVYAFTVNMQPQGYDPERRHAFETALLERLQGTAGVRAAALTVNPPFGGVTSDTRFSIRTALKSWSTSCSSGFRRATSRP